MLVPSSLFIRSQSLATQAWAERQTAASKVKIKIKIT